jgi:hypothetical protein
VAAAVAAVLATLLWSFWIATYKSAKWRFELYALGFLFGLVLFAVLAFATAGSLGSGITAMDNMFIVRKKLLFAGAVAGATTSLAVMLQLALTSLGGIAVAWLITCPVALIIYHLHRWIFLSGGSFPLRAGSVLFAAIGAGLAMTAYRAYQTELAGSESNPAPGVRPRSFSAALGIALGIGGGIMLGVLPAILGTARSDDIPLEAYPLTLLFALGALPSGIVYDIFFSNLPVRSNSVRLTRYLKGSKRQHILAVCGGVIFCAAFLALALATLAPPEIRIREQVTPLLLFGPGIVAALYGIIAHRELSTSRGLIFLYLAALSFVAALGLTLFTA